MTFDPNEVLRRFHRALVREIQDSNPEHLTAPFSVAEIYQNLVPYRTHRDEIGVEMNADYEHALLRLLAGESDFLTIESRTARKEIREELESPNPNTGLYRDFAAADVRLNPEMIDDALMWEPSKSEDEEVDESASAGKADPEELMDDEPEEGEPEELDPAGIEDDEDVVFEEDEEDAVEEDEEEEDDDEEEESVDSIKDDEEVLAEESGEVDSEDDPMELSEEDVSWPGEVEADVVKESVEAVSELEEAGAEGSPKPCAWCREALPDRPGVNFCPFCGCSVHLVPCPECGEELELNWRFCIACGTEVSS